MQLETLPAGPTPFMSPIPLFKYTKAVELLDKNTKEKVKREIPTDVPDPKDTIAYDLYKEARGLFNDRRKEYRRAAPAIILIMLEGCMKQDSIFRMERIHGEKEIPEIRRTNDVLKLRQLMISIHNYTGETTGRKDISKAKDSTLGPIKKSFQRYNYR